MPKTPKSEVFTMQEDKISGAPKEKPEEVKTAEGVLSTEEMQENIEVAKVKIANNKATMSLKEKEKLIPTLYQPIEVGATLADRKGNPRAVILVFAVTDRNPSQCRFSAEFVGVRPLPDRPLPSLHKKGEGKATSLNVHSGVLGGGTKWKT
jgi:hypothetical protein